MKSTKAHLIKTILENNIDFNKEDVNTACDLLFTTIADELQAGNRVELRGFGSFSTRSRFVPVDPRHNKSNNTNRIECKSVYFRMAKALEDKTNTK